MTNRCGGTCRSGQNSVESQWRLMCLVSQQIRSDSTPAKQNQHVLLTSYNTSQRNSIFKINRFDLFHPSCGAFPWSEYVYQQTLCVINKMTSIVLFRVSQLSKKKFTCSEQWLLWVYLHRVMFGGGGRQRQGRQSHTRLHWINKDIYTLVWETKPVAVAVRHVIKKGK